MDADTLDFARLQFGLSAATHFLFVGLTLGLATLVAAIQTRATFSGDPIHDRMVRLWGQLYIINYAVGIVTGLVMELEIGLNGSGLERFAGNVFGSSLALETITAFFVESTFLGLWIFGWGRLNKWAHLFVIWVIVLTAYASAYWIMVSNGFLQHPVGADVVDGVLKLTSAAAVLGNENSIAAFGHVLGGGLVTAGLVMAGVSAYHLRRGTPDRDLFRRCLRIGLWTTLGALLFTAALGGVQFGVIGDTQPLKLDAYGGDAVATAADQALAVAMYGPGNYVPSHGLAQFGNVMMGCWFAMLIVTIVALIRLRDRHGTAARPGPAQPGPAQPRGFLLIPRSAPGRILVVITGLIFPLVFLSVARFVIRLLHARARGPAATGPRGHRGTHATTGPRAHRGAYAAVLAAVPLPFAALVSGWLWRETARQPWTVYGLLRTSDAVSPVSAGTMRFSLIVFAVLFAILLAINYWLLARFARRGPDAATLGRTPTEQQPTAILHPVF